MKKPKRAVSFRLTEKENENLDLIAQYCKFLIEKDSKISIEVNASRSTALSYMIQEFCEEKLAKDEEFINYYLEDMVTPVPNRIMNYFNQNIIIPYAQSEIRLTKSKKDSDNKEHYYALILDVYEGETADFRIVEAIEVDNEIQQNSTRLEDGGLFSEKEKEAKLAFFNI